MCRFPGFLTIAGVCVGVIAAIAIGVAPTTDDNTTQPVPVVVRAERPALALLSAQLFPNASRDTVAVRGQAKVMGNLLEADEPLLSHRLTRAVKRTGPEVAMVSDHEEHGPPYLR